MIFSELYSAYYNTVAKIISRAIEGGLTDKEIRCIVETNAFFESALTIPAALKNEKWQLLKADLSTPIRHKPTMPPTVLQLQWLKAISLDPRIRLFGLYFEGLEKVEPLFTPDDYLVYDKYADGDNYSDEGYIRRFRVILSAVKEKHPLDVTMKTRHGDQKTLHVTPKWLEYSEKDDKFRLITAGEGRPGIINLGRIVDVRRGFGRRDTRADYYEEKRTVTLRITDMRNALERCMMHFAHFEKQAERLDENHYLVRVTYHNDDETEMIIRILGFGPMIEVVRPDSFRELIRERLVRQKELGMR